MPSTNRNYSPDPIVKSLKRRLLVGAAAIAGILFFSHNARAANNPVPFVDIVSPVSITPGSTGVVLTVRGTGFVCNFQGGLERHHAGDDGPKCAASDCGSAGRFRGRRGSRFRAGLQSRARAVANPASHTFQSRPSS